MKKSIRISVTAKDIKNGLPGRARECPIALAASRLLKKKVDVMFQCIAPTSGKVHYILPKAGVIFANKFDQGKKVKPFRFIAKPCDSCDSCD